jgi:hypothetical protein
MMRLRRASAIVVLSLLTSTATAYAECAWVLWHEIDVSTFDKRGQPDGGGEHDWQVGLGTSDEQTCWRGALGKAKEAASRKALPIPGFPDLSSSVEAGTNSVRTTYRRPGDGTIMYVGTVRWLCLPDTVDPRGPKGK